MKKQPPVALVCAGPVSRGVIGSLPGIFERLRWIRGRHPSSSARAVNVLGCGKACREYAELASAPIVVISAPDNLVPEVVSEMEAADLVWADRTVVLFESNFDSMILRPLEKQGAYGASLCRLQPLPDTLLIEGHPEALRRIRSVFRGRGVEMLEIRRGAKGEYLAGVRMATSLFLPTIAGTVDQFCRAGMQKAAAEKTAAWFLESSIRAYFRAGKRLLRNSGATPRV